MNQETKHPPSAAIGPVREFAQFAGEQFAASTLLEGPRSSDRTLSILDRSRTNSMSATSRSCWSVSSGWWRSCATASWPIRGVEETTICPAPAKLQRLLGGAIWAMVIAHDLTAGGVAELESLAAADRHDAPTRAELRRSLIGLEAALDGRFDAAEQMCVRLLEHLTPRESDALARRLERAAVKGHEH